MGFLFMVVSILASGTSLVLLVSGGAILGDHYVTGSAGSGGINLSIITSLVPGFWWC